jgi:hypothetical protein
MDTTNGTSPSGNTQQPPSQFGGMFVFFVIFLNLLAIIIAATDRSIGALTIAMIWGPAVNVLLALSSLMAIPVLRRRQRMFSPGRHLALSICVPLAAIVTDGVVIFSMDLHH